MQINNNQSNLFERLKGIQYIDPKDESLINEVKQHIEMLKQRYDQYIKTPDYNPKNKDVVSIEAYLFKMMLYLADKIKLDTSVYKQKIKEICSRIQN